MIVLLKNSGAYTKRKTAKPYVDTSEKVCDNPRGYCAKCGKYPTEDGDDFCIQKLGRVVNACCGHGLHKGYIQFDNGITIRGYFEVERG